MPYCNNCGTQVNESAKFCENCGSAVNHYQQYGGQPPYNYQYPQYQYVHYVKHKIPGRGFGVSSLVLGIIGMVYSFMMFITAIDMPRTNESVPGIVMLSTLSILAVAFGASAYNRGYKNGVSSAGFILGVIGLIGYITAIIIGVS